MNSSSGASAMVGPVTSLSHNVHCINIIYATIGNKVYTIDIQRGWAQAVTNIFEHNIVDFMTVCSKSIGLCAGDNCLTLVRFEDNGDICQIEDNDSITNLDDRVLDVLLVSQRVDCRDEQVVIGFAHNFLEVWRFGDRCLLRRVEAPMPTCMIFSLSMVLGSSSDDGLCLASGTALGKIVLWSSDIIRNENPAAKANASSMKTLIGHEGVIFRTKWSLDLSKLASVSDDRSVRVWDVSSGTQLWVGWGHICRVWDVCFMPPPITDDVVVTKDPGGESADMEVMVATCSEDGTVRTWNKCGKNLSTFVGHSKHVWRILCTQKAHICANGSHSIDSPENSSSNANSKEFYTKNYLVSGGNEGTLKVWDLERCSLTNSSNDSYASSIERTVLNKKKTNKSNSGSGNEKLNHARCFVVPSTWVEAGELVNDSLTGTQGKNGSNDRDNEGMAVMASSCTSDARQYSRRNGCSNVFIAPILSTNLCSYIFVVLTDGAIWCLESVSKAGSNSWTPVFHLNRPVVYADAHFDADDKKCVTFVTAHPDGHASMLKVVCSCTGIKVKSMKQWKAHPIRTINAWSFGSGNVLVGVGPSRRDMVLTCTISGEFALSMVVMRTLLVVVIML